MIESGSKIVRSSELNLLGQFFLKKGKDKIPNSDFKNPLYQDKPGEGKARRWKGACFVHCWIAGLSTSRSF